LANVGNVMSDLKWNASGIILYDDWIFLFFEKTSNFVAHCTLFFKIKAKSIAEKKYDGTKV
jgi:hypothetical protein